MLFLKATFLSAVAILTLGSCTRPTPENVEPGIERPQLGWQSVDIPLQGQDTVGAIEVSKEAILPAIERKSCRIRKGARFRLFSDGRTDWKSDIMATKNMKYWDIWFIFLDANKTELTHAGLWTGLMQKKGSWSRWDEEKKVHPVLARYYEEAQFLKLELNCR